MIYQKRMTELSTNIKEDSSDLFEDITYQHKTILQRFKEHVFSSNSASDKDKLKDNFEKTAEEIFAWAIKNKV